MVGFLCAYFVFVQNKREGGRGSESVCVSHLPSFLNQKVCELKQRWLRGTIKLFIQNSTLKVQQRFSCNKFGDLQLCLSSYWFRKENRVFIWFQDRISVWLRPVAPCFFFFLFFQDLTSTTKWVWKRAFSEPEHKFVQNASIVAQCTGWMSHAGYIKILRVITKKANQTICQCYVWL